jgi:hypothetical protein
LHRRRGRDGRQLQASLWSGNPITVAFSFGHARKSKLERGKDSIQSTGKGQAIRFARCTGRYQVGRKGRATHILALFALTLRQINPKLKQKLSNWTAGRKGQGAVDWGLLDELSDGFVRTDALPDELLGLLSSYKDLFCSSVQVDNHDAFRASTALHAMSHVLK